MKTKEIKNYAIENKKLLIKLTSVLLISIVFSIFATTAKNINIVELIKDAYTSYSAGEEQVYYLEEFGLAGYEVKDNTLITQSEDPMLFLNRALNTDLLTLTIYFENPLERDLTIQIYYTNDGNSFSENQLILIDSKKGDTSAKVKFNLYVEHLRIDIGNQPNIEFTLDKIIINENDDKVSISDIVNKFIDCLINNSHSGIWLDRFLIFLIIFMFIGIHFVFDINKMYSFMFDKRWIIALIILIFLVGNKYHGDSMSLYDTYAHVQEGQGSEYVEPVLGAARPIRTDEWVVGTPFKLTGQYGDNPYSKYNNIMRGTETLNSIYGAYKGYSTLGKNPLLYAYLIMDVEHAFSFNWYTPIILLFMISIEIFLIISGRNKLLSVTGAFLVAFSSFYLWWGLPIQFMSAQAAIVCAYYFLHCDSKWKKILFAIGTAIAAAMFITNIYPAWQVPLGYMFLGILVWLIHDNWEKIKLLDKKDWTIFALSLLFLLSLVATYLYDISEYTQIVSQTMYPGKRSDSGGFELNKIFYYFQSILYPYKSIGSESDKGVFLSFFPLPLIGAFYLWQKGKRKDWLTGSLIIVSVFLLCYSTVGLPEIIAKITFMSHSLARRAIDIVGFIQIYLIIIILSRLDAKRKIHPIIAVTLSVSTALISMFITKRYFPKYTDGVYSLTAVIVISVICYCMLATVSKKIVKRMLISLIILSIITGITVRPIVKGFDAIYSKPVAEKISEIIYEDKEGKWIAYGGSFILQGFAVACGAPTINSVNIYPNLDLWYALDPNRKYENVYNRYAHVNVNFTDNDTTMELIQEDYFTLNLSYKDINKTGVKYILSLIKLEEDHAPYVNFELIYNEYDCYIYKINNN